MCILWDQTAWVQILAATLSSFVSIRGKPFTRFTLQFPNLKTVMLGLMSRARVRMECVVDMEQQEPRLAWRR